jgi:hypothetical protein
MFDRGRQDGTHGRHNCGDPAGGARRDRTDDLLLAKQALSQLSYGPISKRVTLKAGRLKSGGPGKI